MELTTHDISSLEWWTPRELALRMKVSESTIRNLCSTDANPPADKIKAARLGRQFRIHQSEVDRIRANGMRSATAAVVEVAASGAAIVRGSDVSQKRRLKLG